MSDRFSSHAPSLTGPASSGFAISPSDSLDLPETTRALYIGSGGELTVAMASGQVLRFEAIADGTLLPLRVARVYATDTTAEAIIGLI